MRLNKLALCSRSRDFLPYKGIKVQYGTNKIRFARNITPLCVTMLCIGANMVGPGSIGGIAIRYGLEGPGIGLRWGRDFLQPSSPALGSTQPPVKMGTLPVSWG